MNLYAANNNANRGGVAVFNISGAGKASSILTSEAVNLTKKIFSDCGRFKLAEERLIRSAYNEAIKKDKTVQREKIAKLLGLDIFVLISVVPFGNLIYADLTVVPVNPDYYSLKRRIRLRSKIKLNIALKIAREIAYLHEYLSVIAKIDKVYNNNMYLIDAGEWNGLVNEKSYDLKEDSIRILQTARFSSLIKIHGKNRNLGEKIYIKLYPEVNKIIEDMETSISRNIANQYGLDNNYRVDGKKKLLEGICIVNMGGNLCLPGYGAFLSTSYLGFKDPQPSISGIFMSSTLVAAHFLLPEIMTEFKINFFPWKQDSDKIDRMQKFQSFLWYSIPLTFSTAYMDQLAYQFHKTKHIPPFFEDKDSAAAFFSFFIPGGGLFYKGHRMAGWSFYFSEMIAAGYGVYNYDNGNKGRYALYGLGAVKVFDILTAFFLNPAYSFYNLEKERKIERASVNMGFNIGPMGDNIFKIMATCRGF